MGAWRKQKQATSASLSQYVAHGAANAVPEAHQDSNQQEVREGGATADAGTRSDGPEGQQHEEEDVERVGNRVEEDDEYEVPLPLPTIFTKKVLPKKVLLENDDVEELWRTVEIYLQPATLTYLQQKLAERLGAKTIELDGVKAAFVKGIGGGQKVLAAVWERVNPNNAVEWAQQALGSSRLKSFSQRQPSLARSRRPSIDRRTSLSRRAFGDGRSSTVAPAPVESAPMASLQQLQLSGSCRQAGPLLKDHVLAQVYKEVLPCSVDLFHEALLSDASKFTSRFRAVRKDAEVYIEPWQPAEGRWGLARVVKFRALCNAPMCPPSTAVTEWQHCYFDQLKGALTLETIQHAHDVPFGSSFEVQARWSIRAAGAASCQVEVSAGVHFLKNCLMKSTIRSNGVEMYKQDVLLYIKLAKMELSSQFLSQASAVVEESCAELQTRHTMEETEEASREHSSKRDGRELSGSSGVKGFPRWPTKVDISCVIAPLPYELRRAWLDESDSSNGRSPPRMREDLQASLEGQQLSASA